LLGRLAQTEQATVVVPGQAQQELVKLEGIKESRLKEKVSFHLPLMTAVALALSGNRMPKTVAVVAGAMRRRVVLGALTLERIPLGQMPQVERSWGVPISASST